jgi:outer membrane protein assembly factor BamE (lipoprotein component of BamABCDE complex)
MAKPIAVALVLALASTTAAGCTRIKNTQGYLVDEQLFSAIAPGVDNKDSVVKTLGRPTITSEWNDKRWYYLSRDTEQLAFLTPKPVKQRILVIDFNEQGTVTAVGERGMEEVAEVDPSSDKTPTLGRKTGILQDLFGNIGAMGSTGAPGPGPQ